MKTIIYFLIAIMVLSIILPGYPLLSATPKSLIIQATETEITLSDLTLSAEIISKRLKSYSSNKFEILIIPEKSQIRLTFDKNWDLKDTEKLVLQKGDLSIYETYNRTELREFLNVHNELFSQFNDNIANAIIGCTSIAEIEKIDENLRLINTTPNCKFAWGSASESSEICLYALKLYMGEGPLLEKSDIDNIQLKQENNSKNTCFDIRFKEPAVNLWADVTMKNINRVVAIVLDNEVIFAPVLKSVIKNGICSITGNFSENEALLFTSIANNQSLPVTFRKIVE